MPKVSVITTFYNTSNFIQESLESLFNQSFIDYEVILVNDGSTDDSENKIQKYLDKPNVKYLRNTHNEGIAVSRNRALLSSNSEYISIHDSDDISLPNRLEKECECLNNNDDIDFLGSFAHKINLNSDIIGSLVYPPLNTKSAFFCIKNYKLNPIIDPSCMYRAKKVIEHGGYSSDNKTKDAQDFELWCRLLLHGSLMLNIPNMLIKYRINPNGVTIRKDKEMKEATNIVWSKFNNHNFSDPVLNIEYFKQDSFI